MITLAFYNMKGGVGKTASVVNLSYIASKSGAKTLVWDLDPQGSATYYFRIRSKIKAGKKSLLKSGRQLRADVKGTDYENLDLLPADFSYRHLDIKWEKLKQPRSQLHEITKQVGAEYDVIFLDCPPNLTVVSENVFNAADYIFLPMIPTTLSVRTYETMMAFAKKKKYKPKKIFGFFSMVESRKKLHTETIATIRNRYMQFLQNRIPYLSDIEKMGVHRQPVTAYAPNSASSKAYQALWKEMSEKIQ